MRHEPTSGTDDLATNYRVTWQTHTEDINEHGVACNVQWHTHEEIFTSMDNGWDFYQDKKKGRNFNATWEHIPSKGTT